jgi:hypothetical protein
MATIKKAFQPIISFLEANRDSKVKTILDGVIELASAKTGGGGRSSENVLRDAEGNVVAVFCYYHKKYEPVADVEYGKKATSSTGLNSMCKEGTSNWTKQQRAAKKAGEELLSQVSAGEIAIEDIEAMRTQIKEDTAAITPRADGIGFDTLEEAQAALLG